MSEPGAVNAAGAVSEADAVNGLRRLDRRVVSAWRLTLAITVLVAAAITVVIGVAARSFIVAAIGGTVSIALAVIGAVVIPLRYERFRYAFGPDALELEHGIWWRTRAAVPYHRIQHVDIEQGPILRRFGLVSLELKTASASTIGGLPGLAADDADQLRGWLIARAGTADGA